MSGDRGTGGQEGGGQAAPPRAGTGTSYRPGSLIKGFLGPGEGLIFGVTGRRASKGLVPGRLVRGAGRGRAV